MPLNTLRLNAAHSSHPNDRITFIKPLPRPPTDQASYDTADTILRAIAAQCLPIMKKHYLSVTTLEEYEPNPEFIGRNFNNGEIIQLVLKSNSGEWLPLQMIQMVMMHELAHNMHMNHGKAFWVERNKFSAEMRELWARQYTGEGFWGSGRVLGELNAWMAGHGGVVPSAEIEGLQVCGGTFRSRRRKRKRAVNENGEEPTWKERRDRRIEKKFGKDGMALGEDDEKRLMLEIGRKGPIGGKPRVAQSKRGRELRAAAALARFGSNSKPADEEIKDEAEEVGRDEPEYEDVGDEGDDVKDIRGQRILDSMGFGMIKVCDAEDSDDVQVKQEMIELNDISSITNTGPKREAAKVRILPTGQRITNKTAQPSKDRTEAHKFHSKPPEHHASSRTISTVNNHVKSNGNIQSESITTASQPTGEIAINSESETARQPARQAEIHCPICTLALPNTSSNINLQVTVTCPSCAHVLDPTNDPASWACQSETCRASQSGYVNAGDVGRCGICGATR